MQIDRESCSECLILQNSQRQEHSESKIFFFFRGYKIKEAPTQVFSFEFYEVYKNTYFLEPLQTALILLLLRVN